jgi:selenocysteine-specific elongation factor
MKHVILGTAGHIDHNTALVKALTAVMDRLRRKRGIMTELGFLWIFQRNRRDIDTGTKVVKHMVAVFGESWLNHCGRGVMPQTREHLDICKLLKVRKGLIVLTKIDLVDRDLLELVREEVTDIAKDTFLQDRPSCPFDRGRSRLHHLDPFGRDCRKKLDGLFVCNRSHLRMRFGTVVTGTVVSGKVSLGETVEILPGGLEGKVRNLQVYNRAVEEARAGERAAVNLQGIETSSIERGDVLAHPKTLAPTSLLDVYLQYLPIAPRPLKHRTPHRFHLGTSS